MAKPQIVQKLRHDKLLTQKNFPSFVDTFNYFGDFIENLKGDADVRPDNGCITVDRSNPDHPVIRLKGSLPSGGGGGQASYTEPWTIDFEEDTIYSPMFQIGTFRDEADTDNISLSSWLSSTTTKHLYCVMDIANLSAEASLTERNDWNHVSYEVACLSALSVETGRDDQDQPIIEWTMQLFYKNRYPTAPVWENFQF